MEKTVLKDEFWSGRVRLVKDVMLPYQWRVLNDAEPGAEKSGCIANFKSAALALKGKEHGAFYGFVFQDSDLAKWLEAAAYVLGAYEDTELQKQVDEAVELIAAAQWEDGYINTCTTLTDMAIRFRNLAERHELYVAGHLMEAACALSENTGDDRLLKVMCRFADLICDTFGAGCGQIKGYPGHQEVELAAR